MAALEHTNTHTISSPFPINNFQMFQMITVARFPFVESLYLKKKIELNNLQQPQMQIDTKNHRP